MSNVNNELYHFGVKGMKWGVRRKRNNTDGTTIAKKRKLSDKQKRVLKVGAAAATTVLAVYGAKKLSEYTNRPPNNVSQFPVNRVSVNRTSINKTSTNRSNVVTIGDLETKRILREMADKYYSDLTR